MANENIWVVTVFLMMGISVMFFYIHHKITTRRQDFTGKSKRFSPLMMFFEKFSFLWGVVHSLFLTVLPIVFTGDLVLANFRGLFIVYFTINVILAGWIITLYVYDLFLVKGFDMASELMKQGKG